MRNSTRTAVAFVALVLQLLLPLTASAAAPAAPGFTHICSARLRPAAGGKTAPALPRNTQDFAHCPMCGAGVACATPPFVAPVPAAETGSPRALPVALPAPAGIARHSLPIARGPPASA